jgi:hypothetical protein
MAITTWNRLELDVQHVDPDRGLDAGLEAQLADPLWLLARQTQLGELRGEDAGSPIAVRATVNAHPVTHLDAGGTTTAVPPGVPLEALIEPEADQVDVRWRARGGELLLALLDEHRVGIPAARVRTALPWSYSGDTTGDAAIHVQLASRRWPDGAAIASAIASARLSEMLDAAPADRAALDLVSTAWMSWWQTRTRPHAGDTWQPERLEHDASLRAALPQGTVRLRSPEYPGGRLDWDDFVVERVDAAAPGAGTMQRVDALPIPLDVPGMPVVRFWELEDPRFDPGRISVGPGELGTALIVETALTYAADWFLVGVQLAIGALHHITTMQVLDTFGLVSTLRPVDDVRPDAGWALWRVNAHTGARLPHLFLPASTPTALQGDIIEEVLLVRDELANVAWAIERTTADELGRPLRRAPAAPPAPSPATAADLLYEPLPRLPTDRIPLVRIADDDGARLRRATGVGTMQASPTRGRLLTAGFTLRDDELGREGLVVTRRWQLALDTTGRRWLWCTRARNPGAFQPSVRLAFDELVAPHDDD